MGIDIGDLADGNHFATRQGEFFQHGGGRRRHRQIVAIAGAGKTDLRVADERTGNHTADVIAIHFLSGNLAQIVEALQAKGLFMAGNLEYRIRRSIEDRFAALHMCRAKLIENGGTRSMAVTQITGQHAALHHGVEQGRWKGVGLFLEVAPIVSYRHTGQFPMTRGSVFAR